MDCWILSKKLTSAVLNAIVAVSWSLENSCDLGEIGDAVVGSLVWSRADAEGKRSNPRFLH